MSAPAARCAESVSVSLRGRDLRSIRDLTGRELSSLLALAGEMKRRPDRYHGLLAGRTVALLFEKPSLRTRVSFEVAAHQLGAHVVYLSPQDVGLGTREPIRDVARTLDQMVDAIVARTFSHGTVEELAAAASVPVINALSDFAHPCQALGDLLTLKELKGRLAGLRLAFVGDANNVANSLIFAAALTGIRMTVATPPGYEPSPEVLEWARAHELDPGVACRAVSLPVDAVDGADVIYTDTWISMGQEAESSARRLAFAGFEVTPALLRCARPDAVFMHCLPAHRGQEVDGAVIDGPQSIVFTQAANRLVTSKALLAAILAEHVPWSDA